MYYYDSHIQISRGKPDIRSSNKHCNCRKEKGSELTFFAIVKFRSMSKLTIFFPVYTKLQVDNFDFVYSKFYLTCGHYYVLLSTS